MSNVRKLILAVSTVAMMIAVVACGSDSDNDNSVTAEKSIVFSSVDTPATDIEKRQVLVSDSVSIDGKNYSVGYNTILRSGDKPSADSEVFGTIYDTDGNVVMGDDASAFISDSNDFASLLTGTDGNLYMVSHFESVPAAMYITALSQNSSTGALTAVKTRHIDFSGVDGGWVHCAGSVTPWGTHLGSEEYEPNAAVVDATTGNFNDGYGMNIARYFGLDPSGTDAGYFSGLNVYNYGWQTEVSVTDYDTVSVVKHYTMGRVAHELGYVMPNAKTAYISDDGTDVGLFRFEADTAEDLSSGELFVAVWTQTSAENGGAADISWISLGHATDAEVKTYLDAGTTYGDIFDVFDISGGAACPATHTEIHTTWGHECLMVKTGMEQAASRLETRRYAAMLGGTTEFRKMEGITLDPDNMVMYLGMSEVRNGMLDGSSNDEGGPNHIRLAQNTCGTVFGLDLNSDYVATNMYGVVSGVPVTADYGAADDSNAYDAAGPFANNKCNLDGIANPDNVTFMPGYKTLIIGEDTGSGHQNDLIWAYNVESKTLTRIQTTPYGSETTSPYFYPNIGGWAYLMSVIQHPYGESDTGEVSSGSEERRAYTGFVGPFPAMD